MNSFHMIIKNFRLSTVLYVSNHLRLNRNYEPNIEMFVYISQFYMSSGQTAKKGYENLNVWRLASYKSFVGN